MWADFFDSTGPTQFAQTQSCIKNTYAAHVYN